MQILIYLFILFFFVDFIFTVDKNYYEILQVRTDATFKEIKEAYQTAKEFFNEVKEAYKILNDPKKRKEYDLKHLGKTTTNSKKKNSNGVDKIDYKLYVIKDKIVVKMMNKIINSVFHTNNITINGSNNQIKIYTTDTEKIWDHKPVTINGRENFTINANKFSNKQFKVPESNYYKESYTFKVDKSTFEIYIKDVNDGNDLFIKMDGDCNKIILDTAIKQGETSEHKENSLSFSWWPN